jgi:hypothetical protein
MDLSKLTDNQLEIAIKIGDEAKRQGLNPDFVLPMVMQESGFNPNLTSPKGAFGVMQLMPDTAKKLGVDPKDLDQNIRGGISLLKELVANPKIGNDPYKILAGYNASTETRNKFYETGDLNVLPDETINHLIKVSDIYGGELPKATIDREPADQNESGTKVGEDTSKKLDSQSTSDQKLPRSIAAAAGAMTGTAVGSSAAAAATGMRMKYDIARLVASYPEAMEAFKSGKSPAEVMDIVLKAKTNAKSLPLAQGPLTGEPAGGRMTQNWIGSQDAQGRYTDVGINARDQAEAHQMKRAAMAAEDKIRNIAPEMRPDPNRANLFIPESAGRGPSPRFGGTPNVPIPSAAPPVETPTVMGNLAKIAKNYLPYLKYPVIGGLTGANLAQGAADVYNRVQSNKPWEAALSSAGTAAGSAAPFVPGVAAAPLAAVGAMVPAYLYTRDHPSAHPSAILKEIEEKGSKPNILDLLSMPAYIGAKAARGE